MALAASLGKGGRWCGPFFPASLSSHPVIHRSHIIGLVLGLSLGLFCIDYGRQRPSNDLPRIIVSHPD